MLWAQLSRFDWAKPGFSKPKTNSFVFFCRQLSPDWGVDYESYEWRKLDPNSEECKTMVKEYFLWEGEFKNAGKDFNQGKIFKWWVERSGKSPQNTWTLT